jgi:hypothetical protein
MEASKGIGRLGMGGRKAAMAGISIGVSTMRGARGAHCHRIGGTTFTRSGDGVLREGDGRFNRLDGWNGMAET